MVIRNASESFVSGRSLYRSRERNSGKVLAKLLLVFLLMCVGAIAWVLYNMHVVSAKIETQKRLILYKTNYQKVFDACVEIWNKQSIYRRNMEWNNMAPNDTSKPDPNDPRLPPVIRALGVTYIDVQPTSVRLEMGGGFYHYGLEAFVNGSPGTGTKQLIPGLWYYAEDDTIPPP
jgi:hypothetical protein